MLPTEDAIWIGEELTRRFGLPFWQTTLTATDANRFAIRLARHVTKRPKILVFNWCYHGTVDETFATLRDGVVGPAQRQPRSARRSVGDDARRRVQRPAGARGRARARRRRLRARRAGADEHRDRASRARFPRRAAGDDAARGDAAHHRRDAHDLAPGRAATRAPTGSQPDILTIGKPIAGGMPAAVYGLSAEVGGPDPRAPRRSRRRTPAASAARSPATRCRSPPCARRSSTS